MASGAIVTGTEARTVAFESIDRATRELVKIAKQVYAGPEVGFKERKTSALVARSLRDLGLHVEEGIAHTGLKAVHEFDNPGPRIAVICELDSLRVPSHPGADPETGAAHACGHHAQVGMMLGEKRLHDYAAAFGFGAPTGCGLGGERQGTLHPVSRWDGLTISRLPMGHAIDATAMQVHFSMSVMANRGVLMEPMFVKRVFDAKGHEIVHFNPKAKRRVVSSETADQIVGMLVDVVEQGTARRTAKLPRHTAAGKTGTTQKLVDGRYVRNQQVTSFSGFLPAYNPELVITVVVDFPKGGGTFGGSVCGPAFKNIAEACIAYLGIRSDKQDPSSLALRNTLYGRSRRISD